MRHVRLSPRRVQEIITDLAWALAAAVGLVVAAALTIWGAGP